MKNILYLYLKYFLEYICLSFTEYYQIHFIISTINFYYRILKWFRCIKFIIIKIRHHKIIGLSLEKVLQYWNSLTVSFES